MAELVSDQLGSAADEAVKLLGAAQGWVRGQLGSEHLATGSGECLACPICQAVGALRHVRPETVEHLLDATASFVAAVKTAVNGDPPVPPPPAHRVEHINVREG